MSSTEPTNPGHSGAAAPSTPRFSYGGQAVIEGVMIRGQHFAAVAARRPDGEITTRLTPLNTLYTGAIRRIPLLRGVIVLAETLVLGMQALAYSANVSLQEEEKELGRWSMGLMLATSLGIAIGLFFLLPLFLVSIFDRTYDDALLSNIVEGIIRLSLFLAYVWGIGRLPDIKRVFAYHGAEHMAVKTYEAGEPLETSVVRQYATAHPRCGTAFLLVVMLVAIVVFAFLGKPPMLLRILSRIVLIPVIAGVSYEVIRFSGKHQGNALVRAIMAPSLLLQLLTTRQPDDAQIEVAICAVQTAIAADEGRLLSENTGAPEEPAVDASEVGQSEESLPPSTPP
ncbi:MAG: DUF1385 domain-containing protein [Chloroflexi bacterium]|nr:DUF1385 domain-containing protein [Chloroflexota bacterium]